MVDLLLHSPQREDVKVLVASSDGRGFITSRAGLVAQTRGGKQILNVEGTKAALCREISRGSHGHYWKKSKAFDFQAEEIPEMARGKGVILQRYKDGGISDIKIFTLERWTFLENGRKDTSRNESPPLAREKRAGG